MCLDFYLPNLPVLRRTHLVAFRIRGADRNMEFAVSGQTLKSDESFEIPLHEKNWRFYIKQI
jgi:hypothetical protein